MYEEHGLSHTQISVLKVSQCSGPCTMSQKLSYAFFCIRHPFLSKCLLRMRKHRKSNLLRIGLLRTKVTEAMCKRDRHNMCHEVEVEKFRMIICDSADVTFTLPAEVKAFREHKTFPSLSL